MYFPGATEQFDRLSIFYIVPHLSSEPEDASPLQLISPGIRETSRIIAHLATLPRNVIELVQDRDDLVLSRVAGRGLAVLPLDVRYLEQVLETLSLRIVVVASATERIARKVNSLLVGVSTALQILHATPKSGKLDRGIIRDHCIAVGKQWIHEAARHDLGQTILKDLVGRADPLRPTPLGFRDRFHLLTHANLAVLRSVGCVAEPWDGTPLVGHGDNSPYFDALRQSIEPILKLRASLLSDRPDLEARSPTDLILTVPGVLKSLRYLKFRRDVRIPQEEERLADALLRQITARRGYNFLLPKEVIDSAVCKAIMQMHTQDLEVYTAAVSVRAASNFTPVIRLPSWANGSHQEFTALANARRQSQQAIHKLNRLARSLSSRLAEGVPEWIIENIRSASRVKLCADAPLEWMDIDGFPLMLRADVSRIPVTPGNLFVKNMLDSTERYLPLSDFQKVLVIRSFADRDPIRLLLQRTIKHFSSEAPEYPNVNIVDVRSREEFVTALNNYSGAILVYDGHGSHRESTDVGTLVIGEEHLDPWDLRTEARIPPIVILSACDTHPFDASHATVGNGFLSAGAVTVLGTSVPVGGIDSAILVARLLLRIGAFLPLLITQRPWKAFRWSEILPGMQRRQFVTEALQRLRQRGGVKISDEQFRSISIDVGRLIEQRGDWLGLFIDRIAVVAKRTPERAKDLIARQAAFVEALSYVQLGNPELIVGYPEPA